MTRVAAHLVVAVPAAVCQQAVQAALSDPRLRDAARQLRPGKEYSGYVTAVTPGRWLEIAFAALDLATGRRTHALGWRVTYDFMPLDDGRTRVEVGVVYELLAAIGAGGTLRAQAENDIAHRLAAMYALEVGLRHGAGDDPAAELPASVSAAGIPGGDGRGTRTPAGAAPPGGPARGSAGP